MDNHGLELWVRRDDLLPAWCQGNKYYKLYHNLHAVNDCRVVVSFGGAFSNHLHALALAAQAYGIVCVGIVRGERPVRLSPTLADVEAAGMRLVFASRVEYRRLTGALPESERLAAVARLLNRDPLELHVVPEGGANAAGMAGCTELGVSIAAQALAQFGRPSPYDDVLLPVATGTTLAGLAMGLPRDWSVSGVSVLGATLKGGRSPVSDEITQSIGSVPSAKWRLMEGDGLGGYARTTPALLAFMDEFYDETGILLDQVYTGKLFWVIAQQAQREYWRPRSRLLALHTGGLQGRRGLEWHSV
ncbi:1-aminocyclopropane-1-carboxylate deaminase/D-cysteine desulfhydrase [Simiduia litorea]|uniref:1-aminocyclopropane-1-carboxylate deaminase/D-cysteine desulfhydrase n=1 Tax=Simiduia litorea TaxID=1435348 RepID=UPI0036F1E931